MWTKCQISQVMCHVSLNNTGTQLVSYLVQDLLSAGPTPSSLTPEGEGGYLTVYPESSPNTDSISF